LGLLFCDKIEPTGEMIFFDFLNKNSGAIQAMTTSLLVIVTAFYASFTYRMQKIAKEQIVAKITVSDIVLKSSLETYKKNTNYYMKGIAGYDSFEFHLLFDISNRGLGNGSIEKPILILKIGSMKRKINPRRKERTGAPYQEGPITFHEYKDLGGTIYLKGGGYEKIELEYQFIFDEEFVKSFKDNPTSLEYYIQYKNNLGKEHKRKDLEIKSIR
jgi:hypothetical protein